mgnify:FL=1
MDLEEKLSSTTVTDRVKTNKNNSEAVLDKLNSIEGVEAKQHTTDEFDIPPTAVLKITVDIEAMQ